MAARATLADVAERLRREGLLAGERNLADRAAAARGEAWTDSRKVKSGHLFCAYAGSEDRFAPLPGRGLRPGSAGATVEKRAHGISLPRSRSPTGAWPPPTPRPPSTATRGTS